MITTNRARTGIVGLDEILGDGLPANHLYLIDGSPGTGKTTLALQFLLEGVSLGERGLVRWPRKHSFLWPAQRYISVRESVGLSRAQSEAARRMT